MLTRSALAESRARVVENLAPNPSFRRVSSGTGVMRRNLIANPVLATNSTGYEGSVSGAGVRETVTTPNAVNVFVLRQTNAPSDLRVFYQVTGLVVGRTYTASADVLNEGQPGVFLVATSSNTGTVVQSSTALRAWSRVSLTFVATTTTVWLQSRQSGAATGSSAVGLTALLLEERPGQLPFFSGATPNTRGVLYEWEGTAHASPSRALASLVEVYRNYHRNPGARNSGGQDFTTWAGSSPNAVTTTAAADAAWARSGKAYQVVWTDATNANEGDIGVSVAQVAADTTFTVEFDVVSSRTGTISMPNVYASTGTYSVSARSTTSNTTITANTPTRRWVTFTANAAALTAGLRAVNTLYNKIANDTLQISNVLLYPGPKRDVAWFDGNNTPDADFTPAWTGTADASASVLSGALVQGYTPNNAVVRAISSYAPATDTQMMRTITLSETIRDTFASVGGDTGALRLGMQPGRTYTAVAVLRLNDTRDASTRPGLRTYTRVGSGSYASTAVDIGTNAPGRYEVRSTFTVPVGATEAFIRLYNGGFLAAGDVWFESCMLVEGVYTGPFLDGASPNAAWRGTANDSPSIGYVVRS